MSIHLQTVPIPFGMDPTTYFMNIAGPGAKVAKVNTKVTDYNLMQDIIANSTLGFKSKRDLMNFQNRCIMYFEENIQTVQITFIGNFTKKEVQTFVTNLNKEFNQKHKQSNFHNNTKTHYQKEEKKQEKTKQHKDKYRNNKHKIKPIKIKQQHQENIEEKPEPIIEETLLPENQIIISSNLKDKNIIQQVLNESYIGYNSKEELEAFQKKGKITYNKTINQTYDFIFTGNYDEEEAKKYVKNITEEYALIVQEQTYLKVIEKIKKQNLTLESEIVDNEDSIVLTLNI